MFLINRNKLLQKLNFATVNSYNVYLMSKVFNQQISIYRCNNRNGLLRSNLFRNCNKTFLSTAKQSNFSTFFFEQVPGICRTLSNIENVWNPHSGRILPKFMFCERTVRALGTISNADFNSSRESKLVSFDFDEKVHKSPKNILHNIFNVIAKETNSFEINLQPSYSSTKGKNNNIASWTCTYNLKWPDTMKFTATAQTKQEASHKAALSALRWLRTLRRVTKDGSPVLIDRTQGEQLLEKSIRTLNLNEETIEKMNEIKHIYNDKFVPLLTQNLSEEPSLTSESADEIDNLDCDSQGISTGKKVLNQARYIGPDRKELPISAYRDEILKLVREHRVVLIKGEPGCGKSTRVPQYLLEDWAKHGLKKNESFGIAITQPRRIAAISLAERVCNERNENFGDVVGYQVRLKTNFNSKTGRVLYCTTGILLRHLQSDLSLPNLTHVVLDEVHERDVNTDLLLNLLRTTLERNLNLKLIIMSATMDTNIFSEYFKDVGTIHIPGFTYPVKPYFLDDLKSLQLHKTAKMCENIVTPTVIHEDVCKLIKHIHKTKPEGAILCFLPGWEDITRLAKLIPSSNDMVVLWLHSRLRDNDQYNVFSKLPPGVRKVILSTNIAETSVTIDDVKYVVDTGICKEKLFDNEQGMGCIDYSWISKSSMIQRKGRAGRVQSGESFHLYTERKSEEFSKYTEPEILKTSLTKIILDAKVYSNNMNALEFISQLPTPPEAIATQRAVEELKELQLLNENEALTPLGKTLASFQLEPKFAKVLVNSVVFKCVTPIIDIITLFSSDMEIFSNSLLDKDEIRQFKMQGCDSSDHLAIMRIFETWLEILEEDGFLKSEEYSTTANLVQHKLITLSKLRNLHFEYLMKGLNQILRISDTYSENDELVKAVLLSGVGTLLRCQNWIVEKGRYKKSNVYFTNNNQRAVLTNDSVNSGKSRFPTDIFVHLNKIKSNIRRTTVIRESSAISPLTALLFSDKKLIHKTIDNKVFLGLENTKVGYYCTPEEARVIESCKDGLKSAYDYFIFQMTEGGEQNSDVNKIWSEMLKNIDFILSKEGIK